MIFLAQGKYLHHLRDLQLLSSGQSLFLLKPGSHRSLPLKVGSVKCSSFVTAMPNTVKDNTRFNHLSWIECIYSWNKEEKSMFIITFYLGIVQWSGRGVMFISIWRVILTHRNTIWSYNAAKVGTKYKTHDSVQDGRDRLNLLSIRRLLYI